MIRVFFFTAKRTEQDQYYLNSKQKMVILAGNPRHIGGKYWMYRAYLHEDEMELGADMQKIAISFDFVNDQDIEVDPMKTGRYPVEPFKTKGFFDWIEIEGSDVDIVMRRNAKRLEEEKIPFEFSIKGPYGRIKYLGNGEFYR